MPTYLGVGNVSSLYLLLLGCEECELGVNPAQPLRLRTLNPHLRLDQATKSVLPLLNCSLEPLNHGCKLNSPLLRGHPFPVLVNSACHLGQPIHVGYHDAVKLICLNKHRAVRGLTSLQ